MALHRAFIDHGTGRAIAMTNSFQTFRLFLRSKFREGVQRNVKSLLPNPPLSPLALFPEKEFNFNVCFGHFGAIFDPLEVPIKRYGFKLPSLTPHPQFDKIQDLVSFKLWAFILI